MCPWCETPLDEPAVVALGETAQNPGALDELLRSQAKGLGDAPAPTAGAGLVSARAPRSLQLLDQAFPVTSRAIPTQGWGSNPPPSWSFLLVRKGRSTRRKRANSVPISAHAAGADRERTVDVGQRAGGGSEADREGAASACGGAAADRLSRHERPR